MKILFWEACFSRQRERLKVPNTFHIGYIIDGSQTENKSFAPHHRSLVLRLLSLFSIPIRRSLFTTFPYHNPWLAVFTGALHTNTFQGNSIYFGTGHPFYRHTLVQ